MAVFLRALIAGVTSVVAVLSGFGALAQTITEFPIPTASSAPWTITPGPDGNPYLKLA